MYVCAQTRNTISLVCVYTDIVCLYVYIHIYIYIHTYIHRDSMHTCKYRLVVHGYSIYRYIQIHTTGNPSPEPLAPKALHKYIYIYI